MGRSLSSTLTTLLLITILVMCGVTIVFISQETKSALKYAVRDELESVSIAVANQIDGDVLLLIQPGEEETARFIAIRDRLHQIQMADPDIRYIYTMRKDDGQVKFVVDADYGSDPTAAEIGRVYSSPPNELLEGFVTTSSDSEFTTDEWGTVLSGYSPIKNISGEVVGLVGVDMDSTEVAKRQNFIGWIFYFIVFLAIILTALGVIGSEKVRRKAVHEIEEREAEYRTLFEGANDAIFILKDGRFIDCNKKTLEIFGCTKEQIIGKYPWEFSPLAQPDGKNSRELVESYIASAQEGKPQFFEWRHERCDRSYFDTEISLNRLELQDTMRVQAIVRDVTTRKRAESNLRQMNRKMNLLSSITRHDITNKLNVLLGYLEITKEKVSDPVILGYLKKQENAAQAIQDQIEFTREYQDLGIKEPLWQELGPAISLALEKHDLRGVSLQSDAGGIVLYADPMLGKVFYNLADNSLRHGGKVHELKISHQETETGLLIIWQDNGTGIAEDKKEIIFERGNGDHTGLGLFLIREILSITGMTIRETGEPNSGARFEISVPKGVYRFMDPEGSR